LHFLIQILSCEYFYSLLFNDKQAEDYPYREDEKNKIIVNPL